MDAVIYTTISSFEENTSEYTSPGMRLNDISLSRVQDPLIRLLEEELPRMNIHIDDIFYYAASFYDEDDNILEKAITA